MIDDEKELVAAFHRLYYYGKAQTWGRTTWFGVPIQKCPLDLWVYQEIICEVQPEWIVETGTAAGGSALYLAHLCDLQGRGQVVTVDIAAPADLPAHARVHYIQGSSTDPEVFGRILAAVDTAGPVLVVLDSDHHQDHVAAELRLYSPLVSPGSYLIVEDTNLNGHPVAPEYGPGPREAVDDFLAHNPCFQADITREKFLITANANGYLRRIR